MTARSNDKVEMIPIEQINVVNPRSRGQAKFRQIIDNIAKLGLKRPISRSDSIRSDTPQETRPENGAPDRL